MKGLAFLASSLLNLPLNSWRLASNAMKKKGLFEDIEPVANCSESCLNEMRMKNCSHLSSCLCHGILHFPCYCNNSTAFFLRNCRHQSKKKIMALNNNTKSSRWSRSAGNKLSLGNIFVTFCKESTIPNSDRLYIVVFSSSQVHIAMSVQCKFKFCLFASETQCLLIIN